MKKLSLLIMLSYLGSMRFVRPEILKQLVCRPFDESKRSQWISWAVVFAIFSFTVETPFCCRAQEIGVRVPEGMSITKVATDELATNIFCMTSDTKGQIVVSGPGYVRRLVDADFDGVFDRAVEFTGGPASGAQGMWFEGSDLLCTGDGALLRYKDSDGDGVADGPPEKLLTLTTGGEHMAHAVKRGPDGWLYILCGNLVAIQPEYYSGENSPVKKPEGGFLMRISPDFNTREIVAHGFRNAYDFDFNRAGEIFVYDSDGERDISLPWYRPTRVFQIRPGDHAGWISAGWKRPSYYFDMPVEIGALGRGSPTGVSCYLQDQLGNEYDGAILVADWTFGRVMVFMKDEEGRYDRGNEFAISTGQFGFAVTDLEIEVDGSLLISVGGRGTEGGVYRIKRETNSDQRPRPIVKTPFCSRVRAMWLKSKLEWNGWSDFQAKLRRTEDKVIWVQKTTSAAGGAPVEVLEGALAESNDDDLCASLVRSTSRLEWHQPTLRQIDKALRSSFKKTQTAALESLVGRTDILPLLAAKKIYRNSLFDAMRIRLQELDPTNTRLIFNIIKTWPDDFAKEFESDQIDGGSKLVVMVASARTNQERVLALMACLAELRENEKDRGLILRLAQLAFDGCGPAEGVATVFDGYTPRVSLANELNEEKTLADSLRDLSVGDDVQLDEELRRLSAMLGTLGRDLVRPLDESNEPSLAQDVTWLIQVACTDSPAAPEAVAAKLLGLSDKIEKNGLNIDRNWSPRIGELAQRLFENQAEIAQAVLQNPRYGADLHSCLHEALPNELKAASAVVFQEKIKTNPDHATAAQLRIAATADALDLELFRDCATRSHLRDEAIITLARQPELKDRALFAGGLNSLDAATVKQSAAALRHLSSGPVANELRGALEAASRLGWDKQDVSVRDQLVLLMQKQTGQSFGYEMKAVGKDQSESLAKWRAYVASEFPDQFPESELPEDLDQRLSRIDWTVGSEERGRELYRQHQCVLCHEGGSRLGPKLDGIAKRFSRPDLFRSVTIPNQQVPDQYRALIIETVDGLIIKGTVIYESVDGITLMNATGKTIRVNNADIESRSISSKSLMPEGLLDQVDERGWADLYAFLKTL